MSLKILTGDKDKTTRNVLKQIITSSYKCKITETEEVRDFITAAINQVYDLAILDLDIQPQNNEKIISVIRSVHSNEKLPIVIVTSSMDREKILALLKLGVADIILKPIYQNSASDKLKSLLKIISGNKLDYGAEDTCESSDPSGREKFLLVEQDKTFRANFVRLFGEKYDITVAENGQDGYNLFEKLRPEYIFLSEHLKVINERALVQKIRSTPGGTEAKIYFLSTVLKSTAMKSNLFNGVVEKTTAMDIFYKEFRKVVFGEETNLFQKAGKVLRTEVGHQLGGLASLEFKGLLNMEMTVISQSSEIKVANETLASVELIDEKKEISVTVGLFGASNNMLLIAEKVLGEPVPFNGKAIEAIGSVITAISGRVNHLLGQSEITLAAQPAKVSSRLENKLNFDWDIEAAVKGPSNELYKVGVYCSRYV